MEKTQKKVYILGPAYPFRGGIASSNERMAIEFQNQGWEVKIFTYTVQYPSFIFPGKSQFSEDPKPENLSIERAYSAINPWSWIKLRRAIAKNPPNLLLSRYWIPYVGLSSAFLLRIAKKNPDIHAVAIVDNLIPHQHMPGDQWITKYFINSLDHFVLLSKSVYNEFENFSQGKLLIHLPLPIFDIYGKQLSKAKACEELNLDDSFKYVLFFGFIKPYKGLDLLLESIDLRFFEKNKIKLLIAGEVYGDASKYFKIIRDKELDPVVIFHNKFIENEKVRLYFCVSDLIAQTYHHATQSGISQIALYFEKPMLVTDVGGLSETLEHEKTGLIVPKSKELINAAIRKYFTDSRYKSMKEDIKKEKNVYSWSNFVRNIIRFAEV